MKTRFFCRFIVIILILAHVLTPVAYASSDLDLDSADAWAHGAITDAVDKGFVPIDLQSDYRSVITREEFCRMAVLWVEYALNKDIDTILTDRGLSRNSTAFSDTRNPDVLAAFALRIISGSIAPTQNSPGVFNPGGNFDRQQAATLIMNACRAIGANVDNSPQADFTDFYLADGWAIPGINFVRANGIMSGVTTSPPSFDPKAEYNRQQSIMTFNNIDVERLLQSPAAILTAQQISERCAPAVFTIQIYSYNGRSSGSGSGFFISSDGYAITNYHVAAAGMVLVVMTQDGRVFDSIDDVRIIDTDRENDLALIKVNGTGLPYLELGDSSTIRQGQQVYAIGSPLGLDNTMSQGIVSYANRVIDGTAYTQISVPIAPGSSGGALINENGKVIGVTTAGFLGSGADLNLAIPINEVTKLDRNSTQVQVLWNDVFYPGFSQALDFGAFSGVRRSGWDVYPLGYIFEYDASDFHDVLYLSASDLFTRTLTSYCQALLCVGFEQVSSIDGGVLGIYESGTETVIIDVDHTGRGTIFVAAALKPVYYEEFPTLPDFGWYAELDMVGNPTVVNGSTRYEYIWSDYYYFDEILTGSFFYFMLLESSGFDYTESYMYPNGDASFSFEGNRLSVVFTITQTRVIIDVHRVR